MGDDNYPTQEELDKIKSWPHTDFVGLVDFCISIWTFGDWATRKGSRCRFATGGWSGNEDIIEALRENRVFWMSCWDSSHRGGLYIFKLPRRKNEMENHV